MRWFPRTVLLLLALPGLAGAEEAISSCTAKPGWASRDFQPLPSLKQSCTHRFSDSSQEWEVSHKQLGAMPLSRQLRDDVDPWLGDQSGARRHSLAVGAGEQMESTLSFSGAMSRFTHQTKLEVESRNRLHRNRLNPEDRSELRTKGSLDLGILRPKVEAWGSLTEEEPEILPEIARGLEPYSDTRSQAGGQAMLDLVLPHLPVLSVAVGRDEKEVFRGLSLDEQRIGGDVVRASLWYGGSNWQAYGGSSFYKLRDQGLPDSSDGIYNDHYASASYWPTSTLTISPSLQYSDASYDGEETWIRTLTATLGVYSTTLGTHGLLTFWGGYTHSYDTDDNFDYDQVDLAVGAERALLEIPSLGDYALSVGANVGYSHYFDRLYDESEPGVRVQMSLRIEAPGALKRTRR